MAQRMGKQRLAEQVGEVPALRGEFVCEAMVPVPGTADARGMSRAEPGMPSRFVWRRREHTLRGILRTWKTSQRERGGVEMYLRRHWFEIETAEDLRMVVYCDRRAKDRSKPKARWWVYTVEMPRGGEVPKRGGLGHGGEE